MKCCDFTNSRNEQLIRLIYFMFYEPYLSGESGSFFI